MSKKGLGRGLGALIPGLSSGHSRENLQEIPLDEINPNIHQPRKYFNPESLKELVDSIKVFGVIQPIIVRRIDEGYEIVAGERRFRAAKEAGLAKIKALVKDTSDKDSIQIALIENLQREDLDAIEEAEAYHHLIREYQMTQAELASKIGKSRTVITNALRLLTLPAEIKRMIKDGHISSGHARAIVSLEDESAQMILATKIKEDNLSVREIEKIVKKGAEEIKEIGLRPETENKTERETKQVLVMSDIGKSLSNILKAKVAVKAVNGKGQINISFSTMDELANLISKLEASGNNYEF